MRNDVYSSDVSSLTSGGSKTYSRHSVSPISPPGSSQFSPCIGDIRGSDLHSGASPASPPNSQPATSAYWPSMYHSNSSTSYGSGTFAQRTSCDPTSCLRSHSVYYDSYVKSPGSATSGASPSSAINSYTGLSQPSITNNMDQSYADSSHSGYIGRRSNEQSRRRGSSPTRSWESGTPPPRPPKHPLGEFPMRCRSKHGNVWDHSCSAIC